MRRIYAARDAWTQQIFHGLLVGALAGLRLLGLGKEAGAEVLLEIRRRLISYIRRDYAVARLGGDEFVIMVGGQTYTGRAADSA